MRLLALAVLVLAAPARAQGVATALDDMRLATAVRLALAADPITSPADARVRARSGAVVVEADWPTVEAEARAVSLAGAVTGVASVAMGHGPAMPAAALGAGGAAEPDEAPAEEESPSEPEVHVEPVRSAAPASIPPPPRTEPAVAPAPSSSVETHVVRLGDTLYSIARRYRTTVQELQRLNALGESTDIALGRTLVVRE